MSKRKIGADEWLSDNMYNQIKGKGLKDWKKTERDRPKKIKRHHKERIENGYSWFDWINFDTFIMGVVATGVLKFAEDSVGFFPMDGEKMDKLYHYPEGTLENYKATCGAIYFALTEYLDNGGDYGPGYLDRAEEAKEAMMLFAENTLRWWD